MPFTSDPADAVAREEARVARLERELKESRAALESLRAELEAGRPSPPTAPVVISSPTAPVTSSERWPERRAAFATLAAIPDDEPRLVLATGRYIGEGFDDARLDTLFLAMPVSWKGTLVQYTGRLQTTWIARSPCSTGCSRSACVDTAQSATRETLCRLGTRKRIPSPWSQGSEEHTTA